MLDENSIELVWVVIPTWNREEDLLECLQSVTSSNYPNLKIVVVDNASEDNSVVKVKKQYPNVEIIKLDKNMGAAFASNRGFEIALKNQADFILRLDSDIIIESQLITKLVKSFEDLPEAGIMFPKILRYDSPDTIWFTGAKSHPFLLVSRVNNYNVKDRDDHEITQVDFVPSAAILIKAEALKKVGGFDEIYFVYSEDFDLCLRFKKNGYKTYYIPTAMAWHKIGSDKLSKWGVEQFYRGRMIFYKQNTHGLHRIALMIYAFIYVFYRWIFSPSHEAIIPALKGLVAGLKTK
jgi:GT2 family glycosyltransferase